MTNRFLINRSDAKIMGVAAGLSDYFGMDRTLVRVGLALLAIVFPVTIILYLLTGWLAATR